MMVTVDMGDMVVSPYEELLAYEYLYTLCGSSRSRMSKALYENGGQPTRAMKQIVGMTPDEEAIADVKEYVNGRMGDFSILVEGTPQFPDSLRAEKSPLPVFYYRGDISLIESPCISVVGTRNPSDRGVLAARRIGAAFVEHGITVVAGLAKGIDTVAMTEAIAHGGHVIGVIGTPIDRFYPKENHALQEQVATSHLLVSQVPIYQYDHQEFKTRRFYFTERNVTMAALSRATVIVEAGETSGTRTQARACMDQGRTLVFLPSVIDSTSWAEGFVERGAHVASSVTELMSIVG